jgi:hypothetical protein
MNRTRPIGGYTPEQLIDKLARRAASCVRWSTVCLLTAG